MTDEKLSFYLHALAGHGGQYMRALGSLGRYMNEGVECNHKDTWQKYQHTSKGGGGGRRAGKPVEGERRTLVPKSGPRVTRQVMKLQSTQLLDDLKDTWDKRTWEKAGVAPPTEGQCNTEFTQFLVEQDPEVAAKRARERAQQQASRALKAALTAATAGEPAVQAELSS